MTSRQNDRVECDSLRVIILSVMKGQIYHQKIISAENRDAVQFKETSK